MTPAQFKAAREALGLKAPALARRMRANSARAVYAWERGERGISGIVETALEGLLRAEYLEPADFGITPVED